MIYTDDDDKLIRR